MGGSGMQRGGGSSGRIIMALSLGGLVVVTFLYLTKRVESSKSARELEITKIESRDISEGLNNKIVQYMEKIESLTQESSVSAAQLESCQVASESLEEEKVRSEAAKKSCEADFHKAQTSLDATESELDQVMADRDAVFKDNSRMITELSDLQEENADLSTINDRLESEVERLRSQTDKGAVCSRELAEKDNKLKVAVSQSSSLLGQVAALTQEKQALQKELTLLKVQLANSQRHSLQSPARPLPLQSQPPQPPFTSPQESVDNGEQDGEEENAGEGELDGLGDDDNKQALK